MLLPCKPPVIPRCGLECDLGVYLEIKIINHDPYPKNIMHIHTSDIRKLDKVKLKSHHGCEIVGVKFGSYFFFSQCSGKPSELV